MQPTQASAAPPGPSAFAQASIVLEVFSRPDQLPSLSHLPPHICFDDRSGYSLVLHTRHSMSNAICLATIVLTVRTTLLFLKLSTATLRANHICLGFTWLPLVSMSWCLLSSSLARFRHRSCCQPRRSRRLRRGFAHLRGLRHRNLDRHELLRLGCRTIRPATCLSSSSRSVISVDHIGCGATRIARQASCGGCHLVR